MMPRLMSSGYAFRTIKKFICTTPNKQKPGAGRVLFYAITSTMMVRESRRGGLLAVTISNLTG